jgi:hypothetical protein
MLQNIMRMRSRSGGTLDGYCSMHACAKVSK